jgi:toxin YoeB
MRVLSWDQNAWDDYISWQNNDRNILKRINKLVSISLRDPFGGIGKPEHLKAELSGCISRRIDEEHRLVYKVYTDRLHIISCKYHY